MATDTWEWRDKPILEAAVEADREGIDYSAAIAELDLAEHDREHGSRALIEGGYLTGQVRRNTPDKATVIVQGVTEKARRATKAWPQQQAYDDLLTLLEAQIASTTEPERKTKLQNLLAALRDLGQGVASEVIARLIERQAGLG